METISHKYYSLLFCRQDEPQGDSFPIDTSLQKRMNPIIDEHREELEESSKELKTYTFHKHTLVMPDGERLAGFEHRQRNSSKTIILVHGHRFGDLDNCTMLARYYTEQNYNVFCLDNRGYGESEGSYRTYGIQESLDLLAWIDFLVFLHPGDEFILHGCSMGGASVCMIADKKLPLQVKALISDSTYTNIKNFILRKLQYLTRYPYWLMMRNIEKHFSNDTGLSLSSGSVLNCVKESKLPMLFIHGGKDELVPVEDAHLLYDACPTDKKLLIVEEADHESSIYYGKDLYLSTIHSFLNPYLKQDDFQP